MSSIDPSVSDKIEDLPSLNACCNIVSKTTSVELIILLLNPTNKPGLINDESLVVHIKSPIILELPTTPKVSKDPL